MAAKIFTFRYAAVRGRKNQYLSLCQLQIHTQVILTAWTPTLTETKSNIQSYPSQGFNQVIREGSVQLWEEIQGKGFSPLLC